MKISVENISEKNQFRLKFVSKSEDTFVNLENANTSSEQEGIVAGFCIAPEKNANAVVVDNMTVKYHWSLDDRGDLDITAQITSPPRPNAVGYGNGSGDGMYLHWGGDGSYKETLGINMKELLAAYPNIDLFQVSLRGYWYSAPSNHRTVSITAKSYEGGYLAVDGSREYINPTGIETAAKTIDVICNSGGRPGDLLAVLSYDRTQETWELIAQ